MATSSCRTLTATSIARPFVEDIKATATSVASTSRRPKLRAILGPPNVGGGDNGPSRTYAQWTGKACAAVGIDFELVEVEEQGAGFGEVEEEILKANDDESIDGIMVYYPCFGPRQDGYLQNVVSAYKDVEGMNFTSLFKLYHNIRFTEPISLGISPTAVLAPQRLAPSAEEPPEGMVKSILPCTPLAIVKTLEYAGVYDTKLDYGSRAYGKVVTIINRSEVVGRPLAALLANDGARVFSIDVDSNQEFTRRPEDKPSPAPVGAGEGDTRNLNLLLPRHVVRATKLSLQECLELSDVVVSGVPGDKYKIKTSELKQGVITVNFSSGNNFEEDVKSKASIHIPAIGKVTITMLQRNLLRLAKYRELAAAQIKA